MIRNHINWVREVEGMFDDDPDFQVISTSPLALFAFRFNPDSGHPDEETRKLCNAINDDGRVFLTRASCGGMTVIRVSAGTFGCTREDVLQAYHVAKELSGRLDFAA